MTRSGELPRGREERVDNDRVVEPQLQRRSQDECKRQDAFHARDQRLLDAAGQLQVAPDQHVEHTHRHDGGLQGASDLRGIASHVVHEDGVQPGVELGKEPHDA